MSWSAAEPPQEYQLLEVTILLYLIIDRVLTVFFSAFFKSRVVYARFFCPCRNIVACGGSSGWWWRTLHYLSLGGSGKVGRRDPVLASLHLCPLQLCSLTLCSRTPRPTHRCKHTNTINEIFGRLGTQRSGWHEMEDKGKKKEANYMRNLALHPQGRCYSRNLQ